MPEFSASQKLFLKQLVTDLKEDFAKQAKEIKDEVKQQIGDLKREVDCTLKSYEEKILKLEKKNKTLENEVKELDRKTRKNNIVIFGIDKIETDLQKSVLKLFNQFLKLNITENDINDIYYLGSKNKANTPILVEFLSYQKKILLLKNCSKLREKGIFIAQDQHKEDREIKKILLKHRWEARQKGIQAYIKGNKLYIGKERYTVEELENPSSSDNVLERDPPNSAPSTPNPYFRQKKLFAEFGTEDIQQDNKKCRPETLGNAKISPPRTLRSNFKP